ncbi:MAG: hypothetical protein CMN60_01620 [Sphingobium sp.]|nr:hypothetical protein [Alteromonas macleodii]MBS46459.1 hypothetical protein [Sphingobium sp.]|tara:strand:- start:4757 stop:5560 length:804 start_codon:yes stop_codon:yes gene_type:complete
MDVFLHKLYQKDDELFECFSKVAKELVSEYKNSNYPQSITSLMGLMRTINSLKLAAFDLAEESETHLYAIKTLLRPAIEHFLRFSYLQAQLVKNKNDCAGEEYRKYCVVSEIIAFVKSHYALVPEKEIQEKVLKNLKKNKGFELSNRQLEQIVSKWSYKNIARKLDKLLNKDKEKLTFFRELVVQYSELSSFVHGGMIAETYYHDAFSSRTLENKLREDISLFSFLAATARSHMLMLGCHINPDFNPAFEEYTKKMAQLFRAMDGAK